jgi:hypothetical protein
MEPGDPENPYGVRIVNCFSTAMGLLSATENPKMSRSFGRLRSDDGRRHIGKVPAAPIVAECELRYPTAEPVVDGLVHISCAMEDKWDVYLYEGKMYFSRSWGGDWEFVADVQLSAAEAVVQRVTAQRERAFGDATMAVRQVDFLIKRMLLEWQVPAPLPYVAPVEDTEVVAQYLFRNYGRHAVFGTYEDTLPLQNSKRPVSGGAPVDRPSPLTPPPPSV